MRGLAEASGLPVGVYFQGVGGNALAASIEAARAGADLISCSAYPVALTLHRAPAEELALDARGARDLVRRRHRRALAGGRPRRRAHRRRADRPACTADRRARRRVRLPRRARRGARRRTCAPSRPATGSTTSSRSSTQVRQETGWLPLAAPIEPDPGLAGADQRPLGEPLPDGRRRAARDPGGRYGRTPGEVDPAVKRAVELVTAGQELPVEHGPAARDPPRGGGRARDERGGAAPARALRRVGGAAPALDPQPQRAAARGRSTASTCRGPSGSARSSRSSRSRASARSRSRTATCASRCAAPRRLRREPERCAARHPPSRAPPPELRPTGNTIRVEAPMVGTFYRASSPGRGAVRRGRRPGLARADALHPRGDEAHERGEERARRHRPRDPQGERRRRSSSATSCSSSSR